MKLEEIKEDIKLPYKLYVDLDGVVADFEGFYHSNFGHDLKSASKSKMWTNINAYKKANGSWYANLPLKKDALALWTYVQPYWPTILTASGVNDEAIINDKINWSKAHLPGDPKVIVVINGVAKANYARENAILIDDTPKVIDAWVKAGGIGILHTDTESTIEKLKELGIGV